MQGICRGWELADVAVEAPSTVWSTEVNKRETKLGATLSELA